MNMKFCIFAFRISANSLGKNFNNRFRDIVKQISNVKKLQFCNLYLCKLVSENF